MQHDCNMNELFSRFKNSDFGDTGIPESDFVALSDPSLLAHQQRLGRLERLGINKEEFARAERAVRVDLLGVRDLRGRRKARGRQGPICPPTVRARTESGFAVSNGFK